MFGFRPFENYENPERNLYKSVTSAGRLCSEQQKRFQISADLNRWKVFESTATIFPRRGHMCAFGKMRKASASIAKGKVVVVDEKCECYCKMHWKCCTALLDSERALQIVQSFSFSPFDSPCFVLLKVLQRFHAVHHFTNSPGGVEQFRPYIAGTPCTILKLCDSTL